MLSAAPSGGGVAEADAGVVALRIDTGSVDSDLKVEVGTRASACRADVTDGLTGGDGLSDRYGADAHVSIQRLNAVAVVYHCVVAVTAVISTVVVSGDDVFAAGCLFCGTVACTDIGAAVGAVLTRDGVYTVALNTGDVGAVGRPNGESAAAGGLGRI